LGVNPEETSKWKWPGGRWGTNCLLGGEFAGGILKHPPPIHLPEKWVGGRIMHSTRTSPPIRGKVADRREITSFIREAAGSEPAK